MGVLASLYSFSVCLHSSSCSDLNQLDFANNFLVLLLFALWFALLCMGVPSSRHLATFLLYPFNPLLIMSLAVFSLWPLLINFWLKLLITFILSWRWTELLIMSILLSTSLDRDFTMELWFQAVSACKHLFGAVGFS